MDRNHFAVSTMIAQRNRGLKAYCRKMEENCEALEGADALLLLSEKAAFRGVLGARGARFAKTVET